MPAYRTTTTSPPTSYAYISTTTQTYSTNDTSTLGGWATQNLNPSPAVGRRNHYEEELLLTRARLEYEKSLEEIKNRGNEVEFFIKSDGQLDYKKAS